MNQEKVEGQIVFHIFLASCNFPAQPRNIVFSGLGESENSGKEEDKHGQ